jgi:hypothetical protein
MQPLSNLKGSAGDTFSSCRIDLRYLRQILKISSQKIKIALKIKIFMWFISKKVLLTRDNLAKRNWNGNTKCSFCDAEKSVEHLFIFCSFARLIWPVIFAAYNIPPPSNVTNMFGNWLNGTDKLIKLGFVLVFRFYVGQFGN